LYFEPLTLEDVLSIYDAEKPDGVVVQFGGQTPLNLADDLAKAGVKIIGTTPETIAMAEDRDLFRKMMQRLEIPQPESGMVSNIDEALEVANRIGYPLMVRPSFVLGGRAMEVVHDEEQLREYVKAAVDVSPERPILIDRFLVNAIETEADAICDGTDAFVPSVMEHVELAGVHSGDSACVIPPINLTPAQVATIRNYTRRIAVEMGVVGLMNIQYAIENGVVYILEANPRASRTVPLVSKVCNTQMAALATRVMLGEKIKDMNLLPKAVGHFGVKEAVFPFSMFPEVDPILGPEMRSTGEVLGLAHSFGLAFYKAEEAAGCVLPTQGTVLMTVSELDRKIGDSFVRVARGFSDLGFKILATEGTAAALKELGIPCQKVNKVYDPQPNLLDALKNGEVHIVVNTPLGRRGAIDDSYIRKTAIRLRIPYMTTLAAAYAALEGIRAIRHGMENVSSLQEYHR
ncbi:MAG: ATP-grasp domain-containing protein, partial [Thermoguttaceae bacterium]|nr:ATP-grasp domain-containing protein [Thermoguttaceae bacterium]